MKTAAFEEIEHTADLALRVRGESLADLLHNAAQGLIHILQPQFRPGKPETRVLHLEAEDAETLLVSWLEELLFLLETEGRLPTLVQLHLEPGNRLEAHVQLEKCESVQSHIKAVTFNDLNIRPSEKGLLATVVFDV